MNRSRSRVGRHESATRRGGRRIVRMVATLIWAVLYVVLSAALSPGILGQVGLLSLFLIGGGVLWNADAVAAAWREDRETRRNR